MIRLAAAAALFGALLRAQSTLAHVATHPLPSGTHRAEMLPLSDGGLMIVVVQPGGAQGVGQIKHRAYRFDANWNQVGAPFPVTAITAEFGEPADHRALLVNGELVVFYQSLIFASQPGPSGPAETSAIEQSLMMARFSLDGRELDRRPVVAHRTNFQDDNFPDFCVLWRGDRYLVSTGSMSSVLKIREVGRDAAVLATHVLNTSPGGIGGTIGNSLYDSGDSLYLLSATDPQTAGLTLTELDTSLQPLRTTRYDDPVREQNFPVGNLKLGDRLLVGYISRARGGPQDPQQNPYDPWLKSLSANFSAVDDFRVGQGGFLHVHTTVAQSGGRAFVAWSKAVSANGMQTPQVMIEEYAPKPVIAPVGVVSAASYLPGIASGAWTSIFGQNLAPAPRALAAGDIVDGVLPTTLGGVSVQIDGKPAYLAYVSATQLNVLVPASAATGNVAVTVTSAGITSDAALVAMHPSMPAFFALPTVKPGQTVELYGTGFGAITPAVLPGTLAGYPATLNANVTVTIGGIAAPVAFAGRTAPGLDQINVTVPNLPDGDYAVVATVNGATTPAATMKVRQ